MEKILSVFVDESGDFGIYKSYSPYYIVTMVFHDQSINIKTDIDVFESRLSNMNHSVHAVHTGPLIRREDIYINDFLEERKKLFDLLFNFSRRVDIKYVCSKIKKKECSNAVEMTAKVSKSIANIFQSREEFLNDFDQIIIYYDNGQIELTKILTSVFTFLFSNVEFRKVKPADYRLFQVADMICTLELISEKIQAGIFSKSEKEFFENKRTFNKNYLKPIRKKEL